MTAVVAMITCVTLAQFVTSPALAMIGPSELLTTKDAPESICRLIIRSTEGLSVCSGTLIEQGRVVTANHCFTGLTKPRTTAECGVIGYEPAVAKQKTELTISRNSFITMGVYFRESAQAIIESSDPSADQLILKLDHALTLKPMKLAGAMTESELMTASCSMAGFGLDKNLRGGRLQIGRLPLFEIEKAGFTVTSEVESTLSLTKGYVTIASEQRALISTATTNSMSSAIGTPGDSGAGVYCTTTIGEPVLTAVVSTVAAVQDQTPQKAGRSKPVMNLWQYQMRANFIKTPISHGAP